MEVTNFRAVSIPPSKKKQQPHLQDWGEVIGRQIFRGGSSSEGTGERHNRAFWIVRLDYDFITILREIGQEFGEH